MSDTIRVDFAVVAAPIPPNQTSTGNKVVNNNSMMNESNENGQENKPMNPSENGQQNTPINPDKNGQKKKFRITVKVNLVREIRRTATLKIQTRASLHQSRPTNLGGKAPVWIELSGVDSKHSPTEKLFNTNGILVTGRQAEPEASASRTPYLENTKSA